MDDKVLSERSSPRPVEKETEPATDISDYMDTTEDKTVDSETNVTDVMDTSTLELSNDENENNKTNDDSEQEDEEDAEGEDESEDDDDDEDCDEANLQSSEPLATTRSRRTNAGNRMSTLLLEEEDEFYTTSYGGFKEEDDDDDFDEEDEADEVEVEEDYDVDSDFDIDETDEIAPEYQAVDEEKRTRKSAYREPKRRIHQTNQQSSMKSSTPNQQKVSSGSATTTTPQSPSKHRPERSFRDSTKKKTAETIKNIESVKKRRKFRNVEPHRRLTQDEMLEEAKLTEAENLKSLEIYRRIEAENLKKIKLIKKSLPTPYITYYSSVFTNPETSEKYSRNLCTYVGCEPELSSEVLSAK